MAHSLCLIAAPLSLVQAPGTTNTAPFWLRRGFWLAALLGLVWTLTFVGAGLASAGRCCCALHAYAVCCMLRSFECGSLPRMLHCLRGLAARAASPCVASQALVISTLRPSFHFLNTGLRPAALLDGLLSLPLLPCRSSPAAPPLPPAPRLPPSSATPSSPAPLNAGLRPAALLQQRQRNHPLPRPLLCGYAARCAALCCAVLRCCAVRCALICRLAPASSFLWPCCPVRYAALHCGWCCVC